MARGPASRTWMSPPASFAPPKLDASDVNAALENLSAREVLAAESVTDVPGLRTELEDWIFSLDYADRTLRDHFRLLTLDGCGLGGKPLAVSAAGAILHYLRDTQKAALDHLDRPTFYDRAESMMLDAVTVRNLELVEPLFAGESRESTLIHVLDQTCTGMGGRLLRARLLRPCLQLAEIEARLDAVQAALQATIVRSEMRKLLAHSGSGTAAGEAHARDRRAARVAGAGPVARADSEVETAGWRVRRRRVCVRLPSGLDEVPEVRDRILNAIADEPPVNLADGGTIRPGYHAGSG